MTSSSASPSSVASVTRATLARWAAAASRLSDPAFAAYSLCGALIIVGVCWRFVDLSSPAGFMFDEDHFVENARNYLRHARDWNDHPPLGKLLLLPGMLAFGDQGLGWRISSAVLGVGLIAVAGLNARRLFGSAAIAWLTAALVAADGFYVSYARAALLDTPLTCFMYLALFCLLSGRTLPWLAAAGACVGLAVGTKWTGVCVVLVAPIVLWRHDLRRTRALGRLVLDGAVLGTVALAVYVLIWVVARRMTGQAFGWSTLVASHADLLAHHAGFTTWDNPASSPWYTWPLLGKPILLHMHHFGPDAVRATSTVGNPLVWYATTAAVAWTLVRLGLRGWRKLRAPAGSRAPDGDTRAMVIAIATIIAMQLPFMLTRRQSYIWHYLGAYGVGIALLAHTLVAWSQQRAERLFVFLLVAACVAIFYAPVWTNAILSPGALELRLPFERWR